LEIVSNSVKACEEQRCSTGTIRGEGVEDGVGMDAACGHTKDNIEIGPILLVHNKHISPLTASWRKASQLE
jgi:hypothetical protein